MKSRRVYLALTVSLVLVAAACGGDGGQAISDPSEQGAESGGDGSPGDSLDPPENITIPLPNGGTLTASISDPANRYAYVYAEYSPDAFDEIVAFYTDWAETDPRDRSGGDSSFESQGTTVRAALWNGPASRISVVECAGDSDAVCVEISDNDAQAPGDRCMAELFGSTSNRARSPIGQTAQSLSPLRRRSVWIANHSRGTVTRVDATTVGVTDVITLAPSGRMIVVDDSRALQFAGLATLGTMRRLVRRA